MPGPQKKPPEERVRRNLPKEAAQLVWDGKTRGPDLPLNLPGIKWSTRTLQWWEKFRNSAQAMTWVDTDWEFMLDTALLHNQLWTPKREAVTGPGGKITKRSVSRPITELKALAGEIRQRMDQMGGTPHARLRDAMAITTEDNFDDYIDREVSKTVNYFDRLSKKAAEEGE